MSEGGGRVELASLQAILSEYEEMEALAARQGYTLSCSTPALFTKLQGAVAARQAYYHHHRAITSQSPHHHSTVRSLYNITMTAQSIHHRSQAPYIKTVPCQAMIMRKELQFTLRITIPEDTSSIPTIHHIDTIALFYLSRISPSVVSSIL